MRILKLMTAVLCLLGSDLFADQPYPWQIDLQQAASPVMERLANLHDFLLVIIASIVIFVMILLGYTCYKFSHKRNPTPSTTTHNLKLEIIWTLIPLFILIAIAVPSFQALRYIEKIPNPDMTIKVIGHQWYWEYDYPDNDNIHFDSYIISDKDLKPGQVRLLEVDNRVVLPIETNVRVLLTSYDVIHSWAIPSLGIKTDTVPGRSNETWLRIDKPGVYRGQCSEICGFGHGFMPIVIEAVTKEEFASWVAQNKQQNS